MKLRLTYARQGGSTVDLSVTCDANTTVGDLADFLWRADPLNQGVRGAAVANKPSRLSLAVASGTLDPTVLLGDSGVSSGSHIQLAQGGLARGVERPPALLQVVDGPQKGKTFPLRPGANTVGRGRSCQVVFDDSLVSRSHARLDVGEQVEIHDLGSANGMEVNGVLVDRQALQTNDLVRLGDTVFSVRLQSSGAVAGRVDSSSVAFIRSPRLVPVYAGEEFEAPEVPKRPEPQQFPLFMLLIPLLMGGVMYLTTQNMMSLVFVAMMPLMIIGNYLQQIFGGKAQFKRALKLFREDLATLLVEIREQQEVERAVRLQESPSVAECLDAARTFSPLLWTRRSDSPGFGEVRFGLGTTSSRADIKLPSAKSAARDIFAELSRQVMPYRVIDLVPIVGQPPMHGGVGVAGAGESGLAMARALIVQMAALHSPAEMTICAVTSTNTYANWEWLKWLPHVDGAKSPLAVSNLAASQSSANALVSELEELLAARMAEGQNVTDDNLPNFVLPVVTLLVESDAPVEFARLVALADSGWRYGIYVIWVAAEVAQLPSACRTYVDVEVHGTGGVGYLHSGELVTPLLVEGVSAADVQVFARRLAPVEDLVARSEDASDLPRAVSYLTLVGEDLGRDPEFVLERWLENRSIVTGPRAPELLSRKPANLRGVLGQNASGLHLLDLRVDGPHALVGGTTGSGKSELLQTWILGMAANNSPERLTFLLVDYKGGSAFAECNDLPHTVGLVTDLNENGVRRALTSLSAELKYREHLLGQYSAKDLVTLEKTNPEAAPPSLVIVVDEFAALVQEVPEFVDGVVNVAQRGRSLGLHLVLATQRPSGVIKGNLRANTNLRVALRVADEEDSQDVIGTKMAAFFDADTPGRAVSKTGPGKYVSFQTGYVGGHTGGEEIKVDPIVEELSISGATWEPPAVAVEVVRDPGPTDIKRIVENMRAAHAVAELPTPRKPWLPDLALYYNLAFLPTRRRDDELVFGIVDDPEKQAQPTMAFQPDIDGNMAIFGASGSGKTTLLRTLAVAAGYTVRGGPCHVYGLDFGSKGLRILEPLPHVGAVIDGDDKERVSRLIYWLRDLIDERARKFAQFNASTINEYRQLANDPNEPRILVLVDAVGTFRTDYESPTESAVFDAFVSLALEGRSVGINLVMTADRQAAIPNALASSIPARLVMRLNSDDDYASFGLKKGTLSMETPAGRGIINRNEVQVAVLGLADSCDMRAQATAISGLAQSMTRVGVPKARPILTLPEQVWLSDLDLDRANLPVIGMESANLGPWFIEPEGTFLVAGPPRSGRTSTCLRIREALLRQDPGWQTLLISSARRGLISDDGWTSTAFRDDSIMETCTRLAEKLNAGIDIGKLAIFVENVAEFSSGPLENPLSALLKVALKADVFVVAEGETSTLTGSYGLLALVKASRAGLVLQPESHEGHQLYKTDLPPRLRRADFPPGRGFMVANGRHTLGQVFAS